MRPDKQILFPPFRLDTLNQRLCRGDEAISLRPKSFAVLEYLLERPGRLVTKDELLDAVWPETSVGDAVLKVCIREIREALGDTADSPQFIETAYKWGYRFIAEVKTNNLPVQLTSFIGREREIAEIMRLLDASRLLTLTGAGGSGKTRLAIEAAGKLAGEFDDGIWWVELASLADPTLVPQAVASVLGVREQPGRALIETLADHLRPNKAMLVLDNCEHLVGACASTADRLLRACPRVKILATSREALAITGEVTWPVPPLEAPDPRQPSQAQEMESYEAVRLFLDRACAALTDFALTDQNASAIAQVCHRLEGIPLAIELAAARVKVLAVEQIATRLDDCFKLLTTGCRAALPRHQTLRATIDWSHDLLSEKEKAMLRRLSVFAKGWTLEQEEAICSGCEIKNTEVLDLLSHLVDKSLVIVTRGRRDDEIRYRLLETVRQYGKDKLAESAEKELFERRHADYFLGLVESVDSKINTRGRATCLARLEREHGNLREALRYAIELGETETALRLAGALHWFWFHQGYWSEGRSSIHGALSLPAATERTRLRAKVLFAEGMLAWAQGDHLASRSQLEESVAIWREAGDSRGLAYSLNFLGMEMLAQGDTAQARALAGDSVALFREGDDGFGLPVSLAGLGIAALTEGDYQAAGSFLEESVTSFRASGDNWGLALPLRNLGIIAFRQGDYDRAVALLKESLVVLGEVREKWFVSRSIETLAEATALQGDCKRAARLFGAGEALRESLGASVLPFYRADYDRGLAAARAALDEDALAKAWAEGRMMTLDDVIAYALEDPKRSISSRAWHNRIN